MSSLGDLIRAVRALRPDDLELHTIAEMLGVELGAVAGTGEKPPEIVLEKKKKKKDEEETRTVPQTAYVDFAATRVQTMQADVPAWLAEAMPLATDVTGYREAVLPFDPLIAPNKVRAMLSTLLATTVEEGPIDVRRLVTALARNEPLLRLYRERSTTVRRGVQLLVDRGESMSLFERDAQWLVREVQNVIGVPRVELLYFADCPSRGVGAPGEEEWREYRPPAAGTPVLLLTDFGIGGAPGERASHAEWDQFFVVAQTAASRVFALVPYAISRWPAAIVAHAACVVWDISTTIQMVRRAAAARRRKAS